MTRERLLIGRPALLRQTNAHTLLTLLRSAGACSRADLVRASGLSAPSVTNVVAHLASAGLVEPVGEGHSTGGRPPDMLRFKPERGCVAAVEILSDRIRFLLTDLSGGELGSTEAEFAKSSSTPRTVCARIAKTMRNLLRDCRQSENDLLAVAVGVPAVVNVQDGVVVSFSALRNWRDVPLASMLNGEFACPVVVENDTNLAAQGEHFRGAAAGEADFVYITVGEGAGAGIFLGGRIYHGVRWSAGEIGYLHIPNVSRAHPTIHGHGKLEKILGESGILKNWRAGVRGAKHETNVRTAADVLNLAAEGNARARRILEQRATILADVILNLSLILNPGLILLGGAVGGHPALFRSVNKRLEGTEFGVVRVALGSLGCSAVVWGGIDVAADTAIRALV